MSSLITTDTELFSLIFVWVSLWRIITIIVNWLFEQMGSYHNPGTAFLVYLVIFLASFFVLSQAIEEKEEKENKEKENE